MSRSAPTLIGRVQAVSGAIAAVRLEDDLAGVSPIWQGQLHTVGQVGTMVLFPQGTTRLLGIVTRLSLSQSLGVAEDTAEQVDGNTRLIEVQLVGEIDALGIFQRGVSNHPGIDDPVHFISSHELDSVYPIAGSAHIEVGRLTANQGVRVSLDLEKLVMRHSAVVGSTGSGKSSAVSGLLQSLVKGPWSSANVVVIDSHGEYSAALAGSAAIYDLAAAVDTLVPYWILPAADILDAFTQTPPLNAARDRFAEMVTEARRRFAKSAAWLAISEEEITSDSPIPFDLQEVWFRFDTANRITYSDSDKKIPAIVSTGSAAGLAPSNYLPHSPVNSAPYKGLETLKYGTAPEQLRKSLANPKLKFLGSGDLVAAAKADPMRDVAENLLGLSDRVTLLDVSGVSSTAATLAVGTILRLLFELAWHGEADGVGKNSPILIVVEEAHRYFGDGSSNRLAKQYLEKIAREGRKYGVGMMLVSQRPSELPRTALSQVGTYIALRLNNDADQATIASSLPDGISGLTAILPGLRTGEALIVGEALPLPSRVSLKAPSPWPQGNDPDISSWSRDPKELKLTGAIKRWRDSQ